MQTFKFKFKRKTDFFKKTYKVTGFSYVKDQDKLLLYFPNNSLMEIPNWSECYCWLGSDWMLKQKLDAENKTGVELKTEIPIGVKNG